MNVEVSICDKIIQRVEVDGATTLAVANWFYRSYHVNELKENDIPAEVVITDVQSKMNSENFLLEPEVYDQLYFSETFF